MNKFIIAVFILLISTTILPQEASKNELDSLYNLFTFIKGVNPSDKLQKQFEQDPAIKKCGMELVNTLSQNINSFSIEKQMVLSSILERPQMQTSTITPNGFFRVHYDLTGTNALGYDLNSLLQALDSAYSFEINYLGYSAPPPDGVDGGDDKYDIYVQNLSGLYGYTQFETKISDSRFTSFMVIDNDYTGYYSTGIKGARVTVAHEFHHGIQGGNYAPAGSNSPFRNSDVFYYEITSTAFEEFVFDDVNDYYAYLPSYFQHPERAMPLNDGYNLAIWNIYLQNNFGFDILKRQWDLIPVNDALKAIAISISENGSTFGNELNKFGIWTYFTNSRNIYSGGYFEEASNYPLISPTATMQYSPPFKNYNINVNPTANFFLRLNLPSPDGVFFTIITNSDWQSAIDDPNQVFPATYYMFSDTVTGTKVISDKY
ncbi:MAG TPA: MXAN_6640 family putative metalloprotease [Ignavibacteriaceae bacterium]